MAKDNSNSFNNNSPISKEPDSNKSFVKKVRSRVSGLLPSSLSKWFGNDDNKAIVRQREEEDDDEYYDIQPPSKRAKVPSPGSVNSTFHANSVSPTNFPNDSSRNHNTNQDDRSKNIRSPFSEPIAGPSGIRARKVFTPSIPVNYDSSENLLNGDKDSDSGESTSGYSSMIRIGQKDLAGSAEGKKADNPMSGSKQSSIFNSSTFGGHSRSLFTERSLSPQMNSSLSSRRPSFNASTFGSPNFIDRTLSTKRIINSPFYSGRTMYGGASAYSFQQGKSPTDTRLSIRSQIQVKPVNDSVANSNATLSKTARRILNALEEYTTPISDAKKIPNPSKRSRPEGLLSKYTGANPYLIRDKVMPPSNRELQIPTVPDLLKMKLKERLQDSTVAVRQIATSSKSALNTDEYKIRGAEEEASKHSNKMKNKITSTRQKLDNQAVEEVKLPDVALPITTLPKFDFSLPLPPSCSKPLVTVACNDSPKLPEPAPKAPEQVIPKPMDERVVQVKSDSETVEYRFANPLVLAENLVSIIAINDFKFSDPVFKQKDKVGEVTNVNAPPPSSSAFKAPEFSLNFKSSDSSNITLKRKGQNSSELGQSAAKLLSGSVEEFLAKVQSSTPLDSPTGTWECPQCCIRNLLDKLKCACGALKPAEQTKKESSKPKGFGEQFKVSSDKWECGICMVRNSNADTKCVSCTTPRSKPKGFGEQFKISTDKWECSACMVRNSNTDSKCVSCTTPRSKPKGFGEQFKMSTDKWECDACMVRNSNTDTKCVSCTTPRPNKPNGPITAIPAPVSAFGDKFKAPSSTWECPVCMIRNKVAFDKCEACTTPRPGAAQLGAIPTKSTFGFGDSFKKKTNEWECEVCMVRNPAEKTSCLSCETPKPGTTKVEVPQKKNDVIPTFNFGIYPPNTKLTAAGLKTVAAPSKNEKVESAKPIIFGSASSSTTTTTSSTPTFTFGIVPSASTADSTKKADAKLKEPASTAVAFKTPEKLPEKASPAPTGFTFGSNANPVTPTATADKPPSIATAPLTKPEERTKPASASSTGFTFGTNFAQSTKQPESIKVPPPIVASTKKPSDNLTEKSKPMQPAPATGGFTFGTTAPTLKRSFNESEASSANNLEKDATSTASLIFSPPKLNSVDTNPIKKPALSLNGNANQAETSVFGSITKPTAPTQTMPNSLFTFTSSQAPSVLPTTTAQSGLFNFAPKTTAASMFGTTTATTEAPGFKFSQPEQPSTQPSFSMGPSVPPATSNVFGGNTSTSIFAAPTKSAFETSAAPATALPAFGSVAPSGFGAAAVSEIKPFSFGARTADEPSAPKAAAFSFGQNAKPTEPPKAAAFNFGSAAPPSAAPAPGGFSFNPNANATASINFNFNAPKVENPSPFQAPAPAPAPSIFGTPAPVQPQPQPQPHPVQNGGFNFGSTASSNNVKSGFNFGTTPQFSAPPAAAPSGMFNFGSANPNPTPPATGGFNFGANATPAFNANVKPTFNFTGGATPTFSAQPAAENPVVAQRKKIRAVRRTQR